MIKNYFWLTIFVLVLPSILYGIGTDYKIEVKETINTFREQDSLLNPNSELVDHYDYDNRLSTLGDLKLYFFDYFDFIFRDYILWSWKENDSYNDSDIYNYIIDTYITYRIKDILIFSGGIENNSEGISYAWNPTDLFKPKYNITNKRIIDLFGNEKDSQNKKKYREGLLNYKIESFFEFGSFKFIYAPYYSRLSDREYSKELYTNSYGKKDMFLFKFSSDIFSDLKPELIYFYRDPRSVFGSNISMAFGDKIILQLESTVQRGSDIEVVKIRQDENEPYFIPRQYEFVKRQDNDKLYSKVVFGINLALENNINFITEYYYNQEGYNRNEMNDYFDFLDFCNDNYENPLYIIDNQNLNKYHLSLALERLNISEMARHYLFFRVEKKNLFISHLDVSFHTIVNLIDASYILSPKVEYLIIDGLNFSLYSNLYYGSRDSEFGHVLNSAEISAYLQYSI